MIRKRAFLHSYFWVLLIPCVLGAFYVYATIDKTVYTTTDLVVIPGTVTGTDWKGFESVLVQDLDEYSVYQEFTTQNAAYPDYVSIEDVVSGEVPGTSDGGGEVETPPTSNELPVPPDTMLPEDGVDIELEEEALPPTTDTSEEPPLPLVDDPPAPPETEAPVSAPPEGQSLLWPSGSGLRGKATIPFGYTESALAYPLAQLVEESAVDQDNVVESEEETVVNETPLTEEAPNEETAPSTTEVLEETTEEAITPTESPEQLTPTSTEEPVSTEEAVDPVPLLTSVPTSSIPVCDTALGCRAYPLTFDGFYLPEFDNNEKLDGAQLRFSLAAKEKSGTDYQGPQRFKVEYSFDKTNYTTATVIDVEDEISNAINGGYFLVTFDNAPTLSDLSKLSVRVVYEGNLAAMEDVYVDSVWLQVVAGSFYESGEKEKVLDQIQYERSLLAPHLHELTSTDLDATLEELPSFTLSYAPQENFIKRILGAIFSKNAYGVSRVELVDNEGVVSDMPVSVVYHDATTWTITLDHVPQKMVPGKYRVNVVVNENDREYVDSFEFYWGVLAVNTTKSMYFPGEKVDLQLGAVTDNGDTVCNADLRLKIVDPRNNIFEVPVDQSGYCGANNVTDVPDYLAGFTETAEWGLYTIQLQHFNAEGELVHSIRDTFEVRDYIPYDIKRTAPTRIYPPAPYTVTLDIKANRTFRGDIVERVPRGFVFADTSGAEVTTLPEVTLLTWKDITMEVGDELHLSYVFDAPDISPYMYLLGPLDMDGFKELRQWQIASDAVTALAWLTGTRTDLSTNFNSASPGTLLWSTSTVDSYYFTHSTSTNTGRLTVLQAGDYYIAANLPVARTDGNNSRARIGLEVRVNGVALPAGLGRSGLTEGNNNHSESSTYVNFYVPNLAVNDYIEVVAQGLATVVAGNVAPVSGQTSLYVEYIPATKNIFAATTTRTVASVNLNGAVASPLQWTELRQDTGYVHSDSVSSQNITLSTAGTYLVNVSLPLNTVSAATANVLGRVLLDGVQVSGGIFAQGFVAGEANESDADSSIHFTGIVVSTTTNQTLSITTEAEATAGTTTVPSGFVGSIHVESIPTSETIVLRGRNLSGGTDWSNSPAESVLWDTRVAYDGTTFTHSTTTNSDLITVNTAGDYLLTYNDAQTSATARANTRITVQISGTTKSGARTQSHFLRNTGAHNNSSGALTFLLEGITAAQTVRVFSEQEAANATVDDTTDAVLFLTKKRALNFRPAAATYYDSPFDNIRFASTSPYFDFSTTDPDGSSDIVYEFMISTSSDFAGAVSKVSGTDAGFINTASTTDSSPFVEGNKVRYQLQSADVLSNNTTYYWRVRGKDSTGSNEFGDWSTMQSLTVDGTMTVADWYQTEDGQFLNNTLTGVASAEGGGAVVDIQENNELFGVYAELAATTLKYRVWDGSAWGSQNNGPDVGGVINWVEVAAGVTRDEYVALTLTNDSDVNAIVYSASTSAWGSQSEFILDANTPARKGIAVAYESISGDAIAVGCSAGVNPVYRIWNGVAWSANNTIAVTTGGNCNWLTLAADPISDEMILVVKGAAGSYQAVVWDGSAWSNVKTLGLVTGAGLTAEGMSVVYEESGDQAIVVTTDAANNRFAYSAWNGVEWQTTINVPVTSDFENGHLVRDVGTDRIGLCMVDDAADINTYIWDGDVWGTETQLEPNTLSAVSRTFDCEFETVAGRDGNLVVAYTDNTADEYQYADTSDVWSGPQAMSNVASAYYTQLERAGDGVMVAWMYENLATDRIVSTVFNGTSWANSTVIEATPPTTIAAPRSEQFSMAAKRFNYGQGILRTRAVNFSAVPGKSTWGDLSFNTTEPVGTNVLVRVRYTSTTTCDSLVSNAALPGNTAGFTYANAPVNLSGLSTSTYSQLCLEATIARTGSISATLTDWNLTWVRQPKLIQNAFRWYANGSFITPTDPWPLGVLDIAETTPLSSTESVSTAESIRLRMSLMGQNITTPAASSTFKLQYAEGVTCSPSLTWSDVGAVGSTTAVWRGYANSIVGSDWLSASWGRRIKLTVDKTLVGEAVTSFPVYVNLDDLPDNFFTYVKSDGGDIRVTQSDGLTELPFDLVSINTTTKVGELHFKASLATTTNTDFYLYYGNAAASGYGASATYGSQNVWTSSYAGVYHMIQDPSGSSPQLLDSTSGARHASRTGTASSGLVVAAQIGNGINFIGSAGDYTLDFPTFGIGSTASYTYSAWFKVATTTSGAAGDGAGTYMVDRTTATNEVVGLKVISNNFAHQYRYNDGSGLGALSGASVSTTSWRFVTWGRAYNSNRFITVNNVRATTTDTASALTPPLMRLGGHQGNTSYAGVADELRIASVARTSGWSTTEYNNQSNATGFYAISAEELLGDGRALTSSVLASSTITETYEESSPTRENITAITVGNSAEWDFVLQNNAGVANTNYCFRMVYTNGAVLNRYDNYPRLITNAPPLVPELSAPFDNEQLASTTPSFEFAAADQLNNDVSYEIEIDTEYDFSSPVISRESNANFAQFTNLSDPSQRGLYTSGQTIQFIPNTTLTNSTTYWWRVRAKDDNGSAAYSEWSTPTSFTINTATVITTWYQNTQEQFDTDDLQDAVTNVAGDVRISGGFAMATTTSSAIEYADLDTGNAWGTLAFVDDESSGDIKYSIEYLVSGNEWALIPDADLSGNAAGFDTTGVSLIGLDPEVYSTIRIRAILTGDSSLPRLQSWTVTWGERIEAPAQSVPFDNAKVDTTLPELRFTATDPQGDNLQYQVQISQNYDFTSSSTYLSGVDSGFTNVTTPADTSAFNSGNSIKYTVQSALTNNTTYWWRVRARDSETSNVYSEWSDPTSFTVDTTITVSTWHQTTGEQYATDDLSNIEVSTGTAAITSTVSEAMIVYGESTSVTPRYRVWSGLEWTDADTAESVDALVNWTMLKAAPTRSEYALATLGTDGDINVQIYNANTGTWGNLVELYTAVVTPTLRAVDIGYETTSGDLIAVACIGTEASYAVWNGTSWTATSSIALTNVGECQYVKVASDPTSDELIAVFRHVNTAVNDYEAMVWSGSSFGNATQFGEMADNANEGMALEYEESGNQAVLAVSDNANASFLYKSWNGSAWTTVLSSALQDDFEHGILKRDVGTDRMMLCAIDQDGQVSTTLWNGAAWGTYNTIETTGNSTTGAGRPVSCEFETSAGRDGYVVIPYSDNTGPRYQTYATSTYSGELTMSGFTNMALGYWTAQTIRTGDGYILAALMKDESSVIPNDTYEAAYWNGTSWLGQQTVSTVPSVVTPPIKEPITMAAQISSNFTQASVRSTPVAFSSGDGPRWDSLSWSDTEPGASSVTYHVYYESATGTYSIVPDSALAGNAAGFTTSPVDISGLDTSIYATLEIEADLLCNNGNCPSLQDWTVRWSEGVTVSGTAYAYDQSTLLATGTVAIAINGVIQVGKTADIANGFTTASQVYTSAGTSTFVVPAGVTQMTVKAWGGGGGGGGGGPANLGGAGGGAGYITGTISTTPGESLSVRTGGGGSLGVTGSAAGGGGGGGYSAVYRVGTSLVQAGGGGGGGGGAGGVNYIGVGTACGVTATTCTPTLPASTIANDVLIAVVHSRTDTVHTCTTNCAGWTEFSTQAGSVAEGRVSVWWYRQSGAPPANPTFAGPVTETYTARIWGFRGVSTTGNPYDILSTNSTEAAATPFTGDSITSTVPNVMNVYVGGSMDDNSWGPGSGICTMPTGVDTNYYSANINGTDNSIFLCNNSNPTNTAGPLAVPAIAQVANGPDVGRSFGFTLRPSVASILAAGAGGVGGGSTGGTGGTSGSMSGGGAGTQVAGGAAGGSTATAGSALTGGNGAAAGTGGGSGGAGGLFGGGTGGTGTGSSSRSGAGGGAGGRFGGGGGAGASSSTVSSAGGGGGSSYIISTGTATSTASGTSTTPGGSADGDYALGAGTGGAGGATSSSGVAGNPGRVVLSYTATTTAGAWSISNVNIRVGDIVTVFINGATSTSETIGVTKYDGVGNVSGMQLAERHLSLGSIDAPTITNADIGQYDNGDDEDLFYTVSGTNVLTLCAETSCTDARLRILSGTTYQPGANSVVNNFQNSGTFAPATNTLRVASAWQQQGTFTPSLSTVIFTATSGSPTVQTSSSTQGFYNVTFGETSGSATWILDKPLVVERTFGIDYGTLNRSSTTINAGGDVRIGASGRMSGLGTTTFDGTGSYTWTDNNASSTNLGYVVIDGSSKTITLGSAVYAQSVTIGADDTLNASGSGYNMSVLGDWTNNNAFIPQTGTVTFVGTTTGTIARGASAFNNLTFSGVGGSWSFSTTTLAVSGNLTIATGTVTLPTGTTTVAGSFTNSGGTFLHNNGEVRMTSTALGKTITQAAGVFNNAFYDLVFSGSGSWSFTESAATTTRNFRVIAGTVTLPSTRLTVGGDFLTTGTGAFTHNSGEVVLLVSGLNSVSTNGSSFNNLRTRSLGAASPRVRTFADTSATILGNFTLETAGDAVFPTGTLSIGGSLDNDANFTANNGTVRFNSVAGAETIAAGTSSFAAVEFSSVTGDFTLTENATATTAFNLTTAAQFTLQSGRMVSALGTFTNAATASSTTWTGSVLSLSNGSSVTLNAKTHAGDSYATLRATSSTLIQMWNSSATTYETSGATAAIYSQDHAGVDGDLYIYGNYSRTTGTEYWSYATDFDGTALTASTSRQVDVRIASSSNVGLTGASLNFVGAAAASSTINAISGAYGIAATNTTLTAQHFTFAGTDSTGFALRASTTLSTFTDGFFTVVPGRTGITISSTTVANNSAMQLSRIGFATSSAGAGTNVTMVGTSSTFVWFRLGGGNLYGEAYDGNDGNPGSIRFDDSSNSITVSGVVYSNDGTTPQGSPTCNGTTPNVRIVVDGGTYSASTTCAAGTGAYSFASVNYLGDPKIIVYLDTNGGVQGSVVTKTPTTNITNMDVYANRVIVRHQDVAPLTAADMIMYDVDNDSDIRFQAATSTLVLLPNTELFVFATSTFAPGGNVTILGNGSSTSHDGTLQIGTNATFTATSTETHTLGGRLVLRGGGTFTPASSTVVFNATTTGKSVTSSSTVTFNNVQFTGVGGTWNVGANLSVLGSMSVATGTVTGAIDISVPTGSITGNGVLSLGGSGTVSLGRTSTLGGTRAWTFNNLTLGNGSVVGTTTLASAATTTIGGVLTISNAHFLDANDSRFDLAGTSTVLVETGTILEDTSYFRYSGAGANVLSTSYYDLDINAGVGSSTYTATGIGMSVLGTLSIGGTGTSTFNVNTNDPVLGVTGAVLIRSNGILVGSNSATLTASSNWTNLGTFTHSSGTVLFNGAASSTIAAGNSSFNNMTISGTGAFTLSQNATTTGALLLTNHSNLTVSSGVTLSLGSTFTNSLGGAATTFTGSTLSFYGGGTRSINSSTTNDSYGTLSVALGTNVRMWNSSASSYSATGGIYSQDHGGSDGLLNIYGAFTSDTASDHWSYATDFDGTALTIGNSRAVTVGVASGASVRYTGGSLSVVGTTSASTTLQNQGSGTYSFAVEGGTINWDRVQIADVSSSGVVLSGAPIVTDFSRTYHLIKINSATAMTVGGTVINANEAKNFTDNVFVANGGVTGAKNVTATGTSVSSWRFTNHSGNTAGEASDVDPAGDPGYIVWDDSAALITVAGNVYSDEGSTVSTVCTGTTTSIRLVVAGLTTYDVSCAVGTGAYSIPNVAFSPLDTLTLYINGATPKAVNVSTEPLSSISTMHLYENRVIVRHESTNPMTIAKMSVWDSGEDADIPFTAIDAATDTLTLPANRKLLIWTGKTFAPGGNVTLSGGGAGAAYDGTLEALTSATFRSVGTETHSIGGSIIFGTGATFTAGLSTTTFTASAAGRTVDVNGNAFYNAAFTGSGSWTITDATSTYGGSYSQSNGAVTFGSATTTVGRSFTVTGGTFAMAGGPLYFTATSSGNQVRFGGSLAPALRFSGTGGTWTMTDTNATTTGAFRLDAGTVTLPSGNLGVGASFINLGGTLVHNTADLIMTATSSATLTASGSDLYAVAFTGSGPFTVTGPSVTFLDSFTVASGSVAMATGTTAVGGSFAATGGTFAHGSGTVLFNAASAGKTINPGTSSFYDVQIGAPLGSYTLQSATTTNNFTLASLSGFTLSSGATLRVGGVFTNSVGGATTTWTGSTLALTSGTSYSINSRTASGDVYGTLSIGANTHIRGWYSSAATTSVNVAGSLYSQDNNNVNGHLYIYGTLALGTTTEYWNYATDFDGTSLSGSERKVSVFMGTNATTTLTSGTLQILGATSSISSVEALNSSTTYSLAIDGGTLYANSFSFANLGVRGLQLSGLSTITDISNGYFNLGLTGQPLITLASTTLNANPSKIFNLVGFNATLPLTGYNIELVGSSSNAWRFTNNYGNIGGEANDIDGIDACGSIRFSDSACLLTEQTHFRWRTNNGGEGAPTSEWYSSSWDYRKRVRFDNTVNESAATTSLKVTVTYDSDMQSDFDDLRFTSSDGLTLLPHWIERYTASTDAVVWVRVPSVAADAITTVFMYYGNATATSASAPTSTFSVIDTFDDNSISEYSGDVALFRTDTAPVYGGSYALEALNQNGRTTDGIYRTDMTVSQGQLLRWMQYIDTTGTGDEACTLFGVQSPGSTNNNYAVCLEQFGTDRISLAKNVSDNDVSGTVLATSSVTFTTGWYEVEVDWKTTNVLSVALYNPSGTLVTTLGATDASYTTGGLGYTFWFQKGAWDSFTARTRGAGRPTVYFGAEQVDGGASWAAALDTVSTGYQPGDIARLRISIENSGLAITGKQFRLEYAAKGVAPTCESIAAPSYAVVPNQASCGSSPVCMATSSSVTNGAVTTDLLFNTNGAFRAGEIVASPSTQSTSIDIDQNYYTELEYVITPTVNASDRYCFRVTNAGTALDFYNSVAEMGLRFDPNVNPIALNQGADISLTPGTTTLVIATTTVYDFNGYTDFTNATATFYRTAVGGACTDDNNNCYRSTTASGTCAYSACSGSSCTLSCSTHMQFHTDATDFGTYTGQEWFAFFEVGDTQGGYGFNSSPGVEVQTLRAITVDSSINYGSLAVSSDTGSYNPTTTVTNLGNVSLNLEIQGSDLSDGAASRIPAAQQKFATSTFTYSGCVSCSQLSSTTPVTLGLNLAKPATITPPVEASVYWGIAVPVGINSAPHSGINIFTPI